MNAARNGLHRGFLIFLAAILAVGFFNTVVFAEGCADEQSQKEVIQCLSQYVTFDSTYGVAKSVTVGPEFLTESGRRGVYDKLMLLEGTGAHVADIYVPIVYDDDTQALCEIFGLTEAPQYNSALRYRQSDISSWKNQGISYYELVMELVARKIVLDKADTDKLRISNQSGLTMLSMEVYDKLMEAWVGFFPAQETDSEEAQE